MTQSEGPRSEVEVARTKVVGQLSLRLAVEESGSLRRLARETPAEKCKAMTRDDPAFLVAV